MPAPIPQTGSPHEGEHLVNQPVPVKQATRRRRPARRPHSITAAVLPVALAVAALAAPASAAGAAPPGQHGQARLAASTRTLSGSAPNTSGSAVRVPGLGAASATVTLISGDQVQLTSAGGGRYAVTAVPAPGSSPAVMVHTHSRPGKASTIQAMPLTAQGLVSTGQLDPGLFDVTYLAAHGDTGPGAQIPLTLQYASHPAAAILRADAGRLPGTRVVGTAQGSGEVTIDVAAAQASAFWAALTGRPRGTPAGVPASAHLTAGLTKVWLTSHHVAAATPPRPQDAGPMSTVTITVTKKTGPTFQESGCLGSTSLMKLCLPVMGLLGVSGPGAGKTYLASPACADQNPCTTERFTFTVANGIYYAQGWGNWFQDPNTSMEPATSWQWVDVLDPQINVAGDTSAAINVDAAQKITISTPRPTQSFGAWFGDNRELPDGQNYLDYATAGYPYLNYWATPTTEPVTAGAFHFESGWDLGEPPMTAAITAPEHLELHPLYPDWYTPNAGTGRWTRFSGVQTYPVVDGGDGQQADFAKIDARGKLVLLRLPDFTTITNNTFTFWEDQLTNALAAGAAGVLYDQQYVGVPWEEPQYSPVHIPIAGILPSEANTLRSLLSNGPVKITIADHGPVHYLYALNFYNEGRVPESLHYTVTSQQLTTREENFHTSQLVVDRWAAFRPNENITSGTGYSTLATPARFTEYFGPESPDLMWDRFPQGTNTGFRYDFPVFAQHGGSGTDDWLAQPTAPGAPETPFTQAQPARFMQFCVNCRQGNTFLPFTYGVSGAGPSKPDGGFSWAVNSPDIHLYDAAGNAIPPTSFFGAASYQLPPQQGRYKFVTQEAAGMSTTWDFTSSAPATDHTPPGAICPATFVAHSADPCQADPLVYLRYNAFTDLSNSVTAPGIHRLQVTAYHEAPGGPPINGLTLWISTDGGTTWQQLHAVSQDGGSYIATYRVPALSSTNGHVSIKAQASDTGGDDITQTILNAYSLTAPPASAGR
jgi:PA domain